MLTKDDFQQIRGIVREEVQAEIRIEIDPLKSDVKTTKKDASKIRQDVDTLIDFFDHEYVELRQRVENIESHLGITYPSN